MVHAVIMAGGVGTRFWPKSRRENPKQFLNVFGETTLIQETCARLNGLVPDENIYVVTNALYVEQTRAQLPNIPRENILAEPLSRNTAPCINFAAVKIAADDPEGVMVVLPADHVIRNNERFHESLRAAIVQAEEPGSLVTIGINPTHPATGYGYIQYERPADEAADTIAAHRVRTFAEKPDVETAERFLDSGDFLWNSGMFVWRVDSILTNLSHLLPASHEAFEDLAGALGTDEEEAATRRAFENAPSISIDYGVMEQARHVYVVPGAFDWSDVGDWRAVYELCPKDSHGNALVGNALVQDSSRCLVEADDRLVVLIGIHDVVVVETKDATLICHRDNAQQVKTVVEYLNSHNLESYT